MPWTKEEEKEYKRLWYIKNKEKILEDQKEYYKIHKDKIKEYVKEYKKEYKKTEHFKKNERISRWKRWGILCFDWNLLNDIYLSTTKCEFCNIKLTIDKKTTSTTKCLDHDHNITDKFNIRGVLCNSCNLNDVLK